MGEVYIPEQKKIISGFIYSDDAIYLDAKKHMEKRYGVIDYESECIPFLHTQYYGKETGVN